MSSNSKQLSVCLSAGFPLFAFWSFKLRIQLTVPDASISPSPHHDSPVCHFLSFFASCTSSLNYIYSCMPWCTVWIFLWDAAARAYSFMGRQNLYSWPWMLNLRGVMMEESCPATRGYGRNNICDVCISCDEPVADTGWHLDSHEGG